VQAPVHVSLRVAADAGTREAAVEGWLRAVPPDARGTAQLVLAEGALFDPPPVQGVPVIGLAGCPCCGGVTLRVQLARALRQHRPARVLILLAGDRHLPRLRRMLADGELGVRFAVDD